MIRKPHPTLTHLLFCIAQTEEQIEEADFRIDYHEMLTEAETLCDERQVEALDHLFDNHPYRIPVGL